MQYTEMDRRELIDKLKRVKNPRERDRIIWALAGQEEASLRNASPIVVPARPAPGRRMPENPPSMKTPEPQNIPQIAIDVKRLFGFMIPGFLILIGLTNIVPALLRFAASGQIEMEIPRLITGGIFLIMGLVGVLKAMHGRMARQDDAGLEKKTFPR